MHKCPVSVYFSGHYSVASLKLCAKLKDIDQGFKLHCHVIESGLLETNPFVGGALLFMYANCGSINQAEQVFNKLPIQDVVSWTTLISAYADRGQCKNASKCWKKMQDVGVLPNGVTFVSILRACENVQLCREIHVEVQRLGLLERDVVIGNCLISTYAKLGSPSTAQEVFETLPVQNIVAWTSLISGHVDNGNSDEAIECFKRMQIKGLVPNAVTYACGLKACTLSGAFEHGQDLHGELERRALLEGDPIVVSALLDMYFRSGFLFIAKGIFDSFCSHCILMWNTLLSGYVDFGNCAEALQWFEQVHMERILPDIITFVSSLKACKSLEIVAKGKELHAQLEVLGFLERDPSVGNALVDMYATCGSLKIARQVFNELKFRDAVAWTVLMAGYAEHGDLEEVLACFEQMKFEGICPDAFTLSCILSACNIAGAADNGQKICLEFGNQDFFKKDVIIGNILVDMHVKCGLLTSAKRVFDELRVRDDVSWDTMLYGYIEHGLSDEALQWLDRVQSECDAPTATRFVLALKACSNLGAADKADDCHCEIARIGLPGKDPIVGNALLGAYVASGLLVKAEEVLDKLSARDVITWTTLMVGYAKLGEPDKAMLALARMLNDGIKPDPVVYVVLLMICARWGAFQKSRTIFDSMTKDYGIVPYAKHHGSIINMFACAGALNSVVEMLTTKPFVSDNVIWHMFLGGCKKWGYICLGEESSTA